MITLKYNLPIKVSTNSIYSWIHFSQRKRIADMFHEITREDCKEFKQLQEKVDILFQFFFQTRYLDSSNCSFIWKCIEDGLVKNGLLKDDTNKYIGKVTYESVLIDKKERKKIEKDYVRILITESDSWKKK